MVTSEVERVYRAYNEAENRHDIKATGRMVGADLTVSINGVSRLSSGADDDRANAELFAAYPDYRREIVDIVASGNRGAVRWRMLGSAVDGSGLPDLDVHGCSVVTVADGQLVEAHLYVDERALTAVLPE